MTTLAAAMFTLALAMILNARQSWLLRTEIRAALTVSALAAEAAKRSIAADRNRAAFGSMSKEHVR